jgi:predicted phage terminase large subunit-like protein
MLGTGRIFNTGTPWHKEDAFEIMPEPERWDCYSTGVMTEDMIQEKKRMLTRGIFAANYELKHIADEDALFSEAQFTDDRTKVYNGICHIDAAYGGEDSTAFTIGAYKDGYLYVYGKKYPKHVDNCIDDILTKKAMYLGGRTYTEDNADKGYLQKELKRRGDLTRTYHESMNKYIKISTYLKGIWDKVIFISDTDPSYIEEILEYNENAAHDDCPDSLSCIARLMWRQFGREEYTAIWN